MIALAKLFDWRSALVVVKPNTFVKWHRAAFRTFWAWKSKRRGRPPLPTNIRNLVREIAADNPIWGEERIADALKLKLDIKFHHELSGSTLHLARQSDAAISAGRRSFGTTQMRLWRAISCQHHR